jgi:hypothetical protein
MSLQLCSPAVRVHVHAMGPDAFSWPGAVYGAVVFNGKQQVERRVWGLMAILCKRICFRVLSAVVSGKEWGSGMPESMPSKRATPRPFLDWTAARLSLLCQVDVMQNVSEDGWWCQLHYEAWRWQRLLFTAAH